jgi:hypothetical protein
MCHKDDCSLLEVSSVTGMANLSAVFRVQMNKFVMWLVRRET